MNRLLHIYFRIWNPDLSLVSSLGIGLATSLGARGS